jgi:hypothetical protein
MTGAALTAVLDCDGVMIHISHNCRTPPLAIPTTARLTLSIAPDVSLSARALWLPVNGIQILPPQASSYDLRVATDACDHDTSAAALSRVVAFPSRKESAFVVVLCSGVQIRNSLLCAIDVAIIDTTGVSREVFPPHRVAPLFHSRCHRWVLAGLARSSCFLF